MEFTAKLCDHHSNKENIPPFSAKPANPIPASVASSKKKFRRRIREPLEDITYFYRSSVQLALAQEDDSLSAISVSGSASNSKKRKASDQENEDTGAVAGPSSKSLRFGFR
ncbi:hypothetical protein MANES_13G138400v8 [Manihot esculenta]|uniref:Uncharacterized protein n=1 Tax=Manihot esculenta TaxID=3983 RepID=A0A2C9URL6_MANES|nr:hypothetical protein MANES_13G138400v8 [Manihot esculenta]